MARELNLTVKRGCTLQSGKIFSVEEILPKGITYAQLMAGIDNGTYTKKSLAGKVHTGQVRDRANAALRADLVFDVTDDDLTFSVSADVTKTWPNEATTLFYDVFETDTTTGTVVPKVEGKISVQPAMTLEDI